MKTLLMMTLLLATPALAGARTLTTSNGPTEFRYDIVKGELKIGKIKLAIGKKYRGLTPLRIRADVEPLGSKALGMSINSVSWVDKQFKPRRAAWDWNAFGNDRKVRAKYVGRKVDGTYFRGETVGKQIKATDKAGFTDLVSFAAWLSNQRMKVGKTLRTTTYTGTQIYKITAKVEGVDRIDLGGLEVDTWKVAITAVRPGKTRTMTMWVEKERKNLAKVVMHADLIGDVTMVLTGTGR